MSIASPRFGWNRYVLSSCLIAVALWVSSTSNAQTVYKSVDEKGNVIYSENPPAKGKSGNIKSTKELTIDPNQNVMPAQLPLNLPPLQTGQDAGGGASAADDVANARAALEEAEAKLKSGSEAQPGDFVGRAGGGVGPSPQRLQRLQELQREVDEAREQLKQAGGG